MVAVRQSCYDIKHPLFVSWHALKLFYELLKHGSVLSVDVVKATLNQGDKFISNDNVSGWVWTRSSLEVLVGGTIHFFLSYCQEDISSSESAVNVRTNVAVTF